MVKCLSEFTIKIIFITHYKSMIKPSSYYLLLDIVSVLIPFAFSFGSKIRFHKLWMPLFIGITAAAIPFIIWDIWFTDKGVWGFNPEYLIGLDLVNLPIEEWLFFILIPYACMFIYESMNYFIKADLLGPSSKTISKCLGIILLSLGFMHTDKMYTSITFISCGLLLCLHGFYLKKAYLGRFFVGYLICLIPFFLVNGILTGTGIQDQIVWYNDAENLGIRMGTIPIEDSMYLMLLLLIITTVHEHMKSKLSF